MTCVIDGCTRTVPPPFCLCNECFKLLPGPLRAELSRAFNPHLDLDEQAPGFHTAKAKVHSWIRETLGGEDRRQHKSWEQLVAWVRARDAARGHNSPHAPSEVDKFDDSDVTSPDPAKPAQLELLR